MNQTIKFIRQNYKSILGSFLLASLLWLVVTTNKDYKYRIEVPFKIERLAEGKVLINPVPDKAVFEVEGKGRALLALNFYKSSIDLELPEIQKSTIINLEDYKSRFNVASELGVKVIDIIEPKTLDLKVDNYYEVKKPVRVQSKIQLAPGYILVNVKPVQDSVLVSGPESLLNRLHYLETESIIKDDVKYPFREAVDLIDPRKNIITLNPDKITVEFEIEQIVERTIYDVPIQIVGLPANLIATPSPRSISLRVKGGESIVTGVTRDELTVFFDFAKNYKPGRLIYDVQIETPENVSWTSASPDKFRLQLKRVDSES